MLSVSATSILSLSKQTARRCLRVNGSNTNNNIHLVRKAAFATTSPSPPPSVKATPEEPLFITRRRYEASDDFLKKTWLADPSTYPIFIVLGVALFISAARCINGFFFNDDVKIDPGRRASVVRSYDEKELGIKASRSVTIQPKTGRSYVASFFEPNSN